MSAVWESNAILAFPNYADIDYYTPTFSGGLFSASAPLTNLQNRFLAAKARTLDCTVEASTFRTDLKTLREIKIIAIPRHNCSLNAVAAFRIYDLSGSVVASGSQEVWPITFPFGSLTFEHESWGTGKLTQEASRYFSMPILFILPAGILGRYVDISISDTGNSAGYLEFSRLFISPGWQPSVNFAYGAKLGVNDPTIVTNSLGGADFYDLREKRRIANLSFDYIPNAEAFTQAFDMQVRLGLSGQLFFIYDPTDQTNLNRQSFLATATSLDPLTAASVGLSGISYSLKEVVA